MLGCDKVRNIIVIGAGGFAKELYGYIQSDISKGYLKKTKIKGFLDASCESFDRSNIPSTYLGKEESYDIVEGDEFLLAVGKIEVRERVINILAKRKANFFTYIHSSVIVDKTAEIGEGVVICPFCMVNANAKVGSYVLMNMYSSIAHDSVLGQSSVLSPYSTINGNVTTGRKLFMGTSSVILLGIKVGDSCVVSAGTVISKDMQDYCFARSEVKTSYLKCRWNPFF